MGGRESASGVGGSVKSQNAKVLSSAGNNKSIFKEIGLPFERAGSDSVVIDGRLWRSYSSGDELFAGIRMHSASVYKRGEKWIARVSFDGLSSNTSTFESKSIDDVIRLANKELNRRAG